MEGEDVAGVEDGGDAAKVGEAGKEEGRTREKRDRESHLNTDEGPMQGIAAGDLRTAVVSERAGKAATSAAESGNQSAEESDEKRAGEGVEDDAKVEVNFFDAGQVGSERAEDLRGGGGEKQSNKGAEESEHEGFRKELAD